MMVKQKYTPSNIKEEEETYPNFIVAPATTVMLTNSNISYQTTPLTKSQTNVKDKSNDE
jgi:hypothetical protein